MSETIVGIGGFLREPACCVLRDGRIVAAVEQAKVSHAGSTAWFPEEAFQIVLSMAGLHVADIDRIAVARPMAEGAESHRLLELRGRFPRTEVTVVEHHQAHAASAYFASGFSEAAVLSIDRAGDFRSAVLFRGEGRTLTPVRELYFPDSLGDLFNRVTELLGYRRRSDEHKVQWLSTSGRADHAALFRSLMHRDGGAWPNFDRSYFDADRLSAGGFSARFFEAIGGVPGAPLPPKLRADLAASLQSAVNETVSGMIESGGQAKPTHVCIAGGLALNALLIRALERRFSHVFVQPASSNAGTALGAALSVFGDRVPFPTLCLGPEYKAPEVKQVLENCKLRFRFLPTDGELIAEAVRALEDNKIVGWMQGRMEFGPRALGNRSILASPLNSYSTENLNIYIKHRENSRKFAASVPAEVASRYFEVGQNAPYLATVGQVRPEHRDQFAAAILGDDLVRVHIVRAEENPLFHALLLAAGKARGLPILYNTSFNLFGDPLVCAPRDAVRSFYSSGIDMLFAGSFVLEK